MTEKKLLHIVTGPTASGKTDHAIELALKYHCPIISADSRQVYKELDIAVAKPSKNQLATVKHYFIDHVSIHEEFNTGLYTRQARELINDLFNTHQQLIVCGGTGLYIKSLIHGLDALPGKDDALRKELSDLLESDGLSALQNILKSLNSEKFEAMDHQNPQRLIRAIEIEKSGQPADIKVPAFAHEFVIKYDVIELQRDVLYDRINRRVDKMFEDGLEKEAFDLQAYQHLNALQTVGYSEWWPYFKGECTIDVVKDKIKQHTRNYAKRQVTWFKHQLE
ncbi:MAG: tRNA (adenosine(37)-N6)-dimethylallyltransferase MiaA [Bacteroidota bacterium]